MATWYGRTSLIWIAAVVSVAGLLLTTAALRHSALRATTGTVAQAALVAQVTVTPPTDGQLPAAPGNLRLLGNDATSYTIGWDASTDNMAVSDYVVAVDGYQVIRLPETSVRLLWPVNADRVSITVAARDGSGNWSEWRQLVIVEAQPRRTPRRLPRVTPTITPVAPAPPASTDQALPEEPTVSPGSPSSTPTGETPAEPSASSELSAAALQADLVSADAVLTTAPEAEAAVLIAPATEGASRTAAAA